MNEEELEKNKAELALDADLEAIKCEKKIRHERALRPGQRNLANREEIK